MDVLVSTSDIFWRVLTVFSLTLFGVVARKTGTFKEEARQSFADTVMNITLPSLVFVSMTSEITWERLISAIYAPVIAFSMILIMSALASGLGRLIPVPVDRRGTFTVLCSMPNSSFIAYPVVLSVLGQEGLAYAVLYDIGVSTAFFSVAIFALQGGPINKKSFRSLLNPALMATIVGLSINRMGITVPELVLAPLRIMGNATVPLAMLLTGYLLAGLEVKSRTLNLELGVVCLCKLILYPVMAYFLVMPFNLEPMVRMVVLIVASMPSMASTPVLVQKYGGDGEFAVAAVFVTTLLSVVTIPLMVRLLG